MKLVQVNVKGCKKIMEIQCYHFKYLLAIFVWLSLIVSIFKSRFRSLNILRLYGIFNTILRSFLKLWKNNRESKKKVLLDEMINRKCVYQLFGNPCEPEKLQLGVCPSFAKRSRGGHPTLKPLDWRNLGEGTPLKTFRLMKARGGHPSKNL